MNVLHVSTVHHAADVRIRFKECMSLSADGNSVTLLARRGAGGTHLRQRDVEAEDGVDIRFLSEPSGGRASRILLQREVVGYIRRNRPDVVHFHDPELLPLLAVLSRPLGYHAIYDVHENLHQQLVSKPWIPRPLRALVATSIRLLEPRFAAMCAAAVIVDQDWAPYFHRTKTIRLRNLPVAAEYQDGPEHEPTTAPQFLYVGTLMPERGSDWLVRVAQGLPEEYRVTVAGPPRHASYLDRLRRLDAGRRVEFPGWVDRRTARGLMSQSLAGIVPLQPIENYDVAIATKLFEYAHAGLPMILSSTSKHRSLNSEYGFGLIVDFDDDRGLADAMRRLHVDRSLAEELGRNAVEFAKAYSWEDEVLPLLGHYRELAASVPA